MTDLIDRQAAIDAIRASASKYTGFMEMEMYTDDDAVEAINGVPSTEPVRHGKWEEQGVFINKQIDEWQEARCSVCRLFHTTPYKYTFIKYAYCPYCGARMDEDERD